MDYYTVLASASRGLGARLDAGDVRPEQAAMEIRRDESVAALRRRHQVTSGETSGRLMPKFKVNAWTSK
jgi:hypothetical protein